MKDNSTFYRQVGESIRAIRGKNLSQEALASAVGLTRSSISNIEKGRQKMLLHTLVDIADALQVEAGGLLPERPAATQADGGALEGLPENERLFIESAIGIKQKGTYGRQKKEDSGAGTDTSSGGEGHRGSRPGMGDRAHKRGPDRR